jgi:MFS family permease
MNAAVARRLPAWEVQGFRQLTLTWVFANLGDSALYLMAAVWVKDLTHSDAAAATVFIALGLPALLAPVLGALADRMSRKRLMVGSMAAMVPIVLCLLLVAPTGMFWIVYVVVFLYGAMGYLLAAAQSGLIRDLVDDDALGSANGALTTLDQGFRLISPLIGTALYVAAGPDAVVLLTAVSFGLAAVQMTRVRVAESAPAPRVARGRYLAELGAGFAHLARTSPLNRLSLALVIAFAAVGLLNVTVFATLDQGLHLPASALGWLVPLQGVGAVVGGVLSAMLVRRFGESRTVALGLLLVAVGAVPTAGTSLILAVIGLPVIGFGIPLVAVGFATLRQRRTPPELQGRTAAAGNVAINVPQTLFSIVGASIIALVDYRILIFVMVAAVAGAAALAASGASREVPAGAAAAT